MGASARRCGQEILTAWNATLSKFSLLNQYLLRCDRHQKSPRTFNGCNNWRITEHPSELRKVDTHIFESPAAVRPADEGATSPMLRYSWEPNPQPLVARARRCARVSRLGFAQQVALRRPEIHVHAIPLASKTLAGGFQGRDAIENMAVHHRARAHLMNKPLQERQLFLCGQVSELSFNFVECWCWHAFELTLHRSQLRLRRHPSAAPIGGDPGPTSPPRFPTFLRACAAHPPPRPRARARAVPTKPARDRSRHRWSCETSH